MLKMTLLLEKHSKATALTQRRFEQETNLKMFVYV
jgi:hypothetical protein